MEQGKEASTIDPTIDSGRALLRHTLATLAYRGGKALREAPESFAGFQASETARTPNQILSHLGDLFVWSLSMCKGKPVWQNAEPKPWPEEVKRFFQTPQDFDDYLASSQPLAAPMEKIFQGPIADALTHVGQINILRRLAGCPVRAENYFAADIVTGRVGERQSAPVREF